MTTTDLRKSTSSNAAHGDTMLAGVVGLGLMGSSISACLLAAGHSVFGVDSDAVKRERAAERVASLLKSLDADSSAPRPHSSATFSVSGDYGTLRECGFIVESTSENIEVKRDVIARIEASVSEHALIGSNTSAIPVTDLQCGALHPGRIVGLHWAEPAHITRFMEIVQGRETTDSSIQRAMELARQWGKDPSLVRKDVRGFITNRIFYAMLREAFHLVESGVASIEDVDRSLRNDLGSWITLAGPFRFMDLTGIPAYANVMRELLPDLDRSQEVPRLMKELVESGARGVANARGFYSYSPEEAAEWESRFLKFSRDIRALSQTYSESTALPMASTRMDAS